MASTIDPPRFLKSEQAAAYIGVKSQTLENWRCTKRYAIPFTRIGRLVRYKVQDLDAWLASRVEQGTELVTA